MNLTWDPQSAVNLSSIQYNHCDGLVHMRQVCSRHIEDGEQPKRGGAGTEIGFVGNILEKRLQHPGPPLRPPP